MRVAIVGAGSPHKTETSIARACRALGHQTLEVNVPGWSRATGGLVTPLLERRIAGFAPDRVVLTVRAIRLGEPALRRLSDRFSSSLWYFDYLLKPDALSLARLATTTFVSYTHHVDRLRHEGVSRVLFLPQGVDPEVDRPALRSHDKYQCDVSFIGSGQPIARREALRSVARVARLQVRGAGWSPPPEGIPVAGGEIRAGAFAEAVKGASISLGLHAFTEQQTVRYSASNRMWRVLGSEGFFLGEYSDGIESFAREGEHCSWFRSTAEMLERVEHFLARPEERRRIADQGRAHALTNHTYAHRVELLLAERGYDPAG